MPKIQIEPFLKPSGVFGDIFYNFYLFIIFPVGVTPNLIIWENTFPVFLFTALQYPTAYIPDGWPVFDVTL